MNKEQLRYRVTNFRLWRLLQRWPNSSVAELADMAGVSQDTVYRHVRQSGWKVAHHRGGESPQPPAVDRHIISHPLLHTMNINGHLFTEPF